MPILNQSSIMFKHIIYVSRLMINVCFFQETFQDLKGGQEEDKPGVGLLYNRRSGPDWMQPLPRLCPLPQVADFQHDLAPPKLPSGRVQPDAPEDKSEGEPHT